MHPVHAYFSYFCPVTIKTVTIIMAGIVVTLFIVSLMNSQPPIKKKKKDKQIKTS